MRYFEVVVCCFCNPLLSLKLSIKVHSMPLDRNHDMDVSLNRMICLKIVSYLVLLLNIFSEINEWQTSTSLCCFLHSNKMLLVCPDPLRLCKLAAVRLGGVNDICQGHELGCN